MTEEEIADIETPHPELTYEVPTFDNWVSCPECHSRHGVQIRSAELEDDATVWFLDSTVLWFECISCGFESKPQPGAPVQQPEGVNDGFSLRDKLEEFVRDHI